MAEVSNYVYSLSDSFVQVNLYGGSEMTTTLRNGRSIKLKQETNYPWDGRIRITVDGLPPGHFAVRVRIPGWCKQFRLKASGSKYYTMDNGYAVVERKWNGSKDEVILDMDMPAVLLETHYLVEETRNQVAVKRGPVVYCLESADLPANGKIFDIALPANIRLKPQPMQVDKGNLVALTGTGQLLQNSTPDNLYHEISTKTKPISIKLIPYYAWANRGNTDMTVWMPVIR